MVEHHFTWTAEKDPHQLAVAEHDVACDDERALEASRRSKNWQAMQVGLKSVSVAAIYGGHILALI